MTLIPEKLEPTNGGHRYVLNRQPSEAEARAVSAKLREHHDPGLAFGGQWTTIEGLSDDDGSRAAFEALFREALLAAFDTSQDAQMLSAGGGGWPASRAEAAEAIEQAFAALPERLP